MKRIVICCGTDWARLRRGHQHVANLEKLAICVDTDTQGVEGVPQIVFQQQGAVAMARDRGLPDRLLVAAYRFLSHNYVPDDEIFLFGSGAGALTVRRLAGMIGRVGLLNRQATVDGMLPQAVARYQGSAFQRLNPWAESTEDFKAKHCHASVRIDFLGVFETVGHLGVPGSLRSSSRLHDTRLSDIVVRARQCVAIDETRTSMPPCLWTADPVDDAETVTPVAVRDVKQVWFPGIHGDVAGGYGETGLSDTTLGWMVMQATSVGLRLDPTLTSTYVLSGSSPIRHAAARERGWRGARARISERTQGKLLFEKGRRRLDPDIGATGLRIASSALDWFHDAEHYRPPNLASFIVREPSPRAEPVVALPIGTTRWDDLTRAYRDIAGDGSELDSR